MVGTSRRDVRSPLFADGSASRPYHLNTRGPRQQCLEWILTHQVGSYVFKTGFQVFVNRLRHSARDILPR